MKLVVSIVLSGLLLVLGAQLYVFWGKENKAQQNFLEFQAKLETAKLDQVKLQEELNYYLNSANLEKELRARFNYRSPDEKLIILVPRNESSTSPNPEP